MEQEKLGIKETSDVVVLVLSGVGVFRQAKDNDGKIGWDDIGLLFPLLPKIDEAVKGGDMIIPELKDLDSEEATELVALVATGLDGQIDESLKLKIEKGLHFIKAGYDLFKAF